MKIWSDCAAPGVERSFDAKRDAHDTPRKKETSLTRIARRVRGLRLLLALGSVGVGACAPSGYTSRVTSTAPVVGGDTHARPGFPPCRRRRGEMEPPDLQARQIWVGGEPAKFGKGEYGKAKLI